MQAQQNAVMKPVHYEKGQSMRSSKKGLTHWAHYAKSPNHVEAAHDEDVIQAGIACITEFILAHLVGPHPLGRYNP